MDLYESRDSLELKKAMARFYEPVEKGWITTEDGQHLFIGGDGSIYGGKSAYEAHQNESSGSSAPEPKNEEAKNETSKTKESSTKELTISNPSPQYTDVINWCKDNGVEYKNVETLDKPLTSQQIIDKIGGGDLTDGSCASLAFAYAANSVGLDVTDYRGGGSQEVFSQNLVIYDIASCPGVKFESASNTNDFTAATSVLKAAEPGKEYILVTGRHAAVVKNEGSGHYKYLELQSEKDNGFHSLTTKELKNRFWCQKSHSSFGFQTKRASYLIDIASLKGSKEFQSICGYINTAGDAQMKGAGGHEK